MIDSVVFMISSMNPGGCEVQLANVLNKLDRQRYRPILCCLRGGAVLEQVAVDVRLYTHLIESASDLRVLPALLRILRAEQPAVVFVVGGGDVGFWGRLAAVVARVPVIVQSHHFTGGVEHWRLHWLLNQMLNRSTDHFVAVAESHRRYLINELSLPPKKVAAIYNGVDVERFRPLRGIPSRRSEFGIPEHAVVVGMVAGFRPEKAHHICIAAIAEVMATNQQVCLVLVGDGPTRPAAESLARRLGISDRIHFLGSRADVPVLLQMFDIVLLPSTSVETFSNAILEAMACSLPVIATRIGSVAEQVVDGETGFLVPPGEVAPLAAAIRRLVEDRRLREQFGHAGYERVRAMFGIQHAVRGREVLFEQLLSRKRKAIKDV